MKEEIRFSIYREIRPKIRPYGPELSDPDYNEVAKLAVELGLVTRPPFPGSVSFRIVSDTTCKSLNLLLEKLDSFGWKATKKHLPRGERELFPLRIDRHYSNDDIEEAEFLYLNSFGNACAGRPTKNGWLGISDKVESWDRPLISFGLFTYFVAAYVKSALEIASLVGLGFTKLDWDDASKVKQEYWEIRSGQEMPDSLLTVVDAGDGLTYYFEEGFSIPELAFERSDVQKMGEFDVAFCREEVGNPKKEDMGKHMLIVSQEFRDVFKRLLIADQVNFLPVRLR